MIYLFDDNRDDQRKEYGASYIDDNSYSDVIKHIEHFNPETPINDVLIDVSAVMIHDSFVDSVNGQYIESNKAKEAILDYLDGLCVPCVRFSGGFPDAAKANNSKLEFEIKKARFYANLRDFLDLYRIEGKMEFKVLVYGKNFRRVELEELVKPIISNLNTKQPDDIAEIKDVMPASAAIKGSAQKLFNLAQPKLGISYEDLVSLAEDGKLTVGTIKKIIINIYNSVCRYGENRYSWK